MDQDSGFRSRPEPDWIPPNGLSIPGLSEIYEKLASYAEEKGFNQQKLWEFLKKHEGAVGTICQVLVLTAPALGIPAVGTVAGGFALIYSCSIAAYTISEYAAYYYGLPSGVTEAEGFWPLYKSLFDTSLAIFGFKLSNVCKWKTIIDIYGQGNADYQLAEQMLEPVKKSAPTIIPQFARIAFDGVWQGDGRMIYKTEEGDFEWSFKADFTEKGLSLSGKVYIQETPYDVSGAICGYIVNFDYYDARTIGGSSWIDIWEFSGSLSADGKSIGGTHERLQKLFGQTNLPDLVNTGTWNLKR